MNTYDDFARAINRLVISESEIRTSGQLAYLGFATEKGYTIAVEGNPNWLWVRIVHGDVRTVDQAFNEIQVPRIPDLPVRVVPFGNKHKIIGYDIRSISFLRGLQIGSREPGSGNVDIVSARRLRPGLVHCVKDSSGSYGLSVQIEEFNYRYQGTDKRFPKTIFNLTPYLPSSNHKCWVKIGINPQTNEPVAVKGPEHSALVSLDVDELDGIPFHDYIPLAGYPLSYDTTSISQEKLFVDCRLWFSADYAGGSGTVSWWDVDLSPATPSAQDDEFSDGTVDSKWTEYDSGSIQTYTESGGELALAQSSQTSATLTGMHQSLPSGNFTLTTKMALNAAAPSGNGQAWQAGLVLWENAASDSADAFLAGLSVERETDVTKLGIAWGSWTANNQQGLLYWSSEDFPWTANQYVYLRLRRSGTTYYFDWSTDGTIWRSEQVLLDFTPSHMGIGLFNKASGSTITASFSFFRRRVVFDNMNEPVHGAIRLSLAKLGDLGDVDLNTAAPGDNQVLKFSASNQVWLPGNAVQSDVSGQLNGLTEKTSPAPNDLLLIEDSGASYAKKKVKVSNLSSDSARVYHDVNQSVPNETSYSVQFNSERWDTNNIHDTTTNNSRLTCNTAGIYVISAHVQWQSNDSGFRSIELRVNGSTVIASLRTLPVSGQNLEQTISTIYKLNINDYVEVRLWQNSGTSINILSSGNYSPEFAMQMIAAI